MSELDPRVLAALRLQLERREAALRAGAARVGWKIGLGIPEVEALIGSEPVFGYLTSASRLEPGGTFRAGDVVALRAETELAVELGDAVAPGAGLDAARAAIAGLGTALELVDVGRPPDDLEGIVAANVFHRAFALGPSRADAAYERVEARLAVDGEPRDSARAARDPAEAVCALARLLGALGERLEPGDRVITGSLNHVPVEPGETVRSEIAGLGAVELAIAR